MQSCDAKKIIQDYLTACDTGSSLFKLKREFVPHKMTSDMLEAALEDMLDSGEIMYTPRGVALQPHTIQSQIELVSDKGRRSVLLAYFNGERMPECSSEETHQIVKDFLGACSAVDEDCYRPTFRKYRFDRDSFSATFGQPVSTFIYLRETCRKGRTDWRNIRFDTTQTDAVRACATEYLKKAGLLEGGVQLPCSLEGITLYLLKGHSAPIAIKELFSEYLDFLSKHLPLPQELDVSYQHFLRSAEVNPDIIFGQASAVRYRPATKYGDRKILNSLKLSQYRNRYLSAEIICRDAAGILETANIRSPYELIYLLKAHSDICDKYKITFSKAPFLTFGSGDAIKQLNDLLRELSPVSGDQLAKEYEQRYGLKANTVKVRLLKEISQYLSSGIYDTKVKSITDKQFERLSGQLEAPWYYTSDVELLFKRRVGKLYQKYMSTENLGKLGYRKTSSVVYSNQYRSLEDCLDKTTWQGNIFQVKDGLWEIQQIYMALQKKAARFEIIEYFPQKFIRLSYLKKNGVHKKDLQAFISAVNAQTADGMYFTLKLLRDRGISLPLEDLGFDDMFYYSVLKQSKGIQARKVAGTYLFRKSKNDATLADFIEYLLTELRSVDLYDLSDLLADKYGMSLTPSYLRVIAANTQMYYDTISEKLFLDYDEYFEEV